MGQIFDPVFTDSIVKILIALALSGVIGFEREINKHFAGFRTHILVGISACLMMLLSINGFEYFIEKYENVRFDPARIPSYVISGIGFLGAGTIMVNRGTIRGLTTAASIWAVAGLGLIVGIGMYKEAVFTTIIILISLIMLNKFEIVLHRKEHQISFEVRISNDQEPTAFLEKIQAFSIDIKEIDITQENENTTKIKMFINTKHRKKKDNLYVWLMQQKEVERIMIKFHDQ